jgi:hypothetical protein
MKKTLLIVGLLFFVNTISFGQVTGNQLYNQQNPPAPYRTSA